MRVENIQCKDIKETLPIKKIHLQ